MPGTQEILALIVVAAIVGFALYRRLRRRKGPGCHDGPASPATKEQPIRWYRREDDSRSSRD